MKMHMVNLLMRRSPIILQYIIILRSHQLRNLAHYGQHLTQLIFGYFSQFGAVVFGDDEGVALGEGLDVEEGEDRGRVVELEAGDIACIIRSGWGVAC